MLMDLLRQQDSLLRPSRLREDYTHVSSLTDPCPRAYALGQGQTSLYELPVTGGHKVMWEIGLAVERHVVEGIVTARNRYGCFGRWLCLCGHTVTEGFYSSASLLCRQCNTYPDRYSHARFRCEQVKVQGHPDLCLFNHGQLIVVEVKSMDGDAFDALTAALPDHILQALSYRRLAQISGQPVADFVKILYTTKKFKFGNPRKEFTVHITPALANVLNLMWDDAIAIENARQAARVNPGSLPGRHRLCHAVTTPRAKKCEVCGDCFSRSA